MSGQKVQREQFRKLHDGNKISADQPCSVLSDTLITTLGSKSTHTWLTYLYLILV